jgi:hypothetical protein
MKRDYEQAQAVMQVCASLDVCSSAWFFYSGAQRMREMDAQQEQRATERINNYRQQQQR